MSRRMRPPGRPSVGEEGCLRTGPKVCQAGLDGERRPRRKEGPWWKPLVRRGTKCRWCGESTPPESSGAVEVAPDALGVDDASVDPRGPARVVPVSSGGLGVHQREVTPAADRSRFPAPDEMEGPGE